MTGGVDGTPGTEATGSITIPSPLTEEEAKKLLGSGFTIDGQVVEFYDSTNGTYNGSGVGVDLKEILSTTIADDIDRSNKLTENLQKSLDGKLENVTMTVDTTDTNKLVIIANEPGAQGNFIKTEDQGIVDQKITLQIGSNKQQVMVVSIGSMSADKLGLVGKPGQDGFADTATVTNGKDKAPTQAAISVGNSEDAGKAITKIDQAIEMVSSQRAALGAVQNRLEHTTSNLGVSEENMTSSLSRIQDADMAYEMAQYTQQNVLSQAATAMLAQANQRPQQVMQLLQR